MQINVRLMLERDIYALLRIQEEAYIPEIHEPEDVIRKRLLASPATAWVAEINGKVVGYLVCYLTGIGRITEFSGTFESAECGDTLYFHDLALSNGAKGLRLSDKLIDAAKMFAIYNKCQYLSLVSVQNSLVFWQKKGFEFYKDLCEIEKKKLEGYAGQAIYMACPL